MSVSSDYMKAMIESYIRKQLLEFPSIINKKLSCKNNKIMNKRDDYNEITKRIDDFLNLKSEERFFALPGLRGVGKTTLLYQTYEYLTKEKNLNPHDVLYISCEKLNSVGDVNIYNIIEIFLEKYHNTNIMLLDKPIFILIDEAHYDKNWALHGKIIYDESPNIFMLITGSSSLHLNFNADAARRLKLQSILPLSYSQHLNLKYDYQTDISNDIKDLILNGKYEKAQEKESQIKQDIENIKNYTLNDWDNYFKYGAFPSTLHKKERRDIQSELWSVISKIISQDMANEYNLTNDLQNYTFRLLVFLASQKPGDISQGKIAANLNTSKSKVNSILSTLEKTQLVFHYEAYGGASKRVRKSWKYYLATASIKNSINEEYGITIQDKTDYEGILLENLVASSLYKISYNGEFPFFNIYYDGDKGGVDFIIQKHFQKPIPIEVGIGQKDNKQIKKAINKFDAEYGIIISNKEEGIEKKNDIIYVPPKTFSLL